MYLSNVPGIGSSRRGLKKLFGKIGITAKKVPAFSLRNGITPCPYVSIAGDGGVFDEAGDLSLTLLGSASKRGYMVMFDQTITATGHDVSTHLRLYII